MTAADGTRKTRAPVQDQPADTPHSPARSPRAGHAGLLIVLSGVLVGAAIAVSLLASEKAQPLIVGLLALLAVVGVFALFAGAVGIIEFAGRTTRNDITKAVADTASDGLVVTEGDGRVTYANAAYLSLAGARSVENLQTVERLFTGAPDVSEAVYRLAQAAREQRSASEEVRLSPPLGRVDGAAWYRVKVRPIEPEGARRATLWTVTDITRDRERQENIFQELQHAIDYLDHAPAGFLSLDAAGDVVYMNATLAGWLDYDLAQFGSGGLKLKDIVPGDGSALLAAVSGGAGEVRTEILDLDLRRRTGESLPVRLFHRVAYGYDGTPGASRTLVLNRSAGEDVAEGQRAAEVRFARFFNNTPLAIATVNRHGRIARTNGPFARLFGSAFRGLDATEPRSILSVVPERDKEALAGAIAAAAAGRGDIAPVELALSHEGNRWARFFVSAVENQQDEGEAAIVYALDTTDQRALEAQFAQAQKMQAVGELAGGVAHDFNNVLQGIIGYADLLLVNHRPTDPSFQDIMQIKQNANRAAGLVRQLLAFSRRQTLRPQVLDFGEVLSELSLLLKKLIGERIELDVRHGRDLWPVKTDLTQFEQVIINLAVNARDAMPEGGRITLRTANVTAAEAEALGEEPMPAADYVLVEVQDTGSGIPADIIDKIFQPFFTTKEVGKGTGLGLSMVYGFVKQVDGFIFCDSEPGKGTTFRIYLPRFAGETHAEELPAPVQAPVPVRPAAAPAPAPDLTGHGTVLLVEDEDAVRAFGARALQQRGYKVLEASSGVDALRVVEEHKGDIDLIVSDVVMPEMDGPTLLGELRRRGTKAKIIFVSGYAEEAFSKNLPDGEEFAFLPKPFTLKQLIEQVKTTLG
ncbi:MAG: ATP-binding protein [Burkholderiales bacterium]|nr:ATP-binding protein [Burkholderiales bacterium]